MRSTGTDGNPKKPKAILRNGRWSSEIYGYTEQLAVIRGSAQEPHALRSPMLAPTRHRELSARQASRTQCARPRQASRTPRARTHQASRPPCPQPHQASRTPCARPHQASRTTRVLPEPQPHQAPRNFQLNKSRAKVKMCSALG